jgi:predicted RNA binding protein YcfA (HicA-like mRNA interferase family)
VPNQVTRQGLERWLRRNGFVLQPGAASGHRKWTREGSVSVTVPGHGPNDLTKKHVGMVVRTLERAGFSRAEILRALRAEG